mgnify:FL=1
MMIVGRAGLVGRMKLRVVAGRMKLRVVAGRMKLRAVAERRTALERKGKNQKQDAASLGSSPGTLHFYSIGLESASERESQPWR